VQAPLETDRLTLRPFAPHEVEAWFSIWGDPEVIWWGAAPSREEAGAGLVRLLERERTWPDGIGWLAVREKGKDEVVGDVLLQPAPFVDGVEVGWHLRTHVQNRGYATEAARAVVRRTLDDGVVDEVYAAVATRNAPSLRVAEKLGMRVLRTFELSGMLHRLLVLP